MIEIGEGQIKLDEPVKEINIYVKGEEGYYKAIIKKVTIDKLGRIYIRVE